MSKTTLEDFLAPISQALGHSSIEAPAQKIDVAGIEPAHVTDGLTGAALVDRFASEAAAVRVHVHRCTKDDLPKTVISAIQESQGDSVIAADDDRLENLGIEKAVKKAGAAEQFVRWDASRGYEACVADARAADIGITFAKAGIAETGTIVQPCDARCGRSISLMPLTHIAIVDASTIVASMIEVLEQLHADGGEAGSKLPSQVCFISGPSMTSDIELVRVEGVHGPMVLHYIIVDDA